MERGGEYGVNKVELGPRFCMLVVHRLERRTMSFAALCEQSDVMT